MLETLTTTSTTAEAAASTHKLKRRKPSNNSSRPRDVVASSSSQSQRKQHANTSNKKNAKAKQNSRNARQHTQQQQRGANVTSLQRPFTGSCKKPPKSQPHTKNQLPVELLSQEEQDQYIAMDCEMVGVGPFGCRSALARVTLLDWNGKIVLDTLVRPQEEVTDYRTFVSGITAEDFMSNDVNDEQQLKTKTPVMDFDACRELILNLIENKVIIGHGLKNDLHALRIYNHPWHLQRDTTKYEPFQRDESSSSDELELTATTHFEPSDTATPSDNSASQLCYHHRRRPKARKLKELVYEKLHRTIQPMGSVHDPIEDALGALDLYKLVRVKWEKCMAYKIAKTNQIMMDQQQQQQQQQTLYDEMASSTTTSDVSLSDDNSSSCDTLSQSDSDDEIVIVTE